MKHGESGRDLSRSAILIDHLPAMRAFVRKHMGKALRDKESSSDILQSSIRELLKRGVEEETLMRRFCQIAKRKIIDKARYWKYGKRTIDRETRSLVNLMAEDREASVSRQLELAEKRRRLEAALGRLSPDYREVVQRIRLDGEDPATVAISMGRSEKSVRHILYRALTKLANDLDLHESP